MGCRERERRTPAGWEGDLAAEGWAATVVPGRLARGVVRVFCGARVCAVIGSHCLVCQELALQVWEVRFCGATCRRLQFFLLQRPRWKFRQISRSASSGVAGRLLFPGAESMVAGGLLVAGRLGVVAVS